MKNKEIYDNIYMVIQMTIVFKVSDNIKEKMIEYYDLLKLDKTPPYAIFQAKEADTIITLYQSGKVVFQGISADIDASMWRDLEKHLNNRNIDITPSEEKKEKIDKSLYYYDTIGSDEVGTGDYFLPIVVTATFVKKSDIPLLEKLKINDSKKMTDTKIRSCAPILIKKLKYSSITLSNKEFNEYCLLGYNANKIKAILHNKVLYKLSSELKNQYEKIIIDQFCYPKVFYSYLENTEYITKGITFTTKAESKNLSVAAASVISRYLFLLENDKLNEKYNITIPKGASDKVDATGKELVNKYGKEILNEISKVNFSNTNKILEKKSK